MRDLSAVLLTGLVVSLERFEKLGARTRVVGSIAIVALAAVVAGLLARAPLERAVAIWLVSGVTGAAVDLREVRHEGGAVVLLDVHAGTRGGALGVDADRVALSIQGRDLSLDVHAPRLSIAPDRWRGDEVTRLAEGVARFRLGDERAIVHLTDGAAYLAGAPIPTLAMSCDRIAGTLRYDRGATTYDMTLSVDDGAASYPVSGSASFDAEGALTHRWTANALPLAQLSQLLPASAGLSFTRGWLRDLNIESGRGLHAAAAIDAGDGALVGRNGQVHALRLFGGPLVLDGDGLGSTGLWGAVDGVPIDFVGEVHGLKEPFAWLQVGSNDLRALERLAVGLSEEPAVQAIHLETTAPGVAFAQYALATEHGPLAVQVLSADPQEPSLSFDTAIAEDHIISSGERTSAMGLRTSAVAGVNGDYFDIGRTYMPQGMLLRSGKLLRGPTDRYVLLVRRDRSVKFAEFRMRGYVRAKHGQYPVTQFNNWPAGEVTVITPDFGKMLPPAAGVTFAELVPLKGNRYRVARVVAANEPLPVVFGIAFGSLTPAVLRSGETVELSYRLDPRIDGAIAAIGGGPLLLKDGQWFEDPHAPAPDERDVRWPVVALGRQRDGSLLLAAVDGRHPERSVGMTRPEFAELLQRLDVVDAMALDSGGSVTMVSRAPGDRNVSVRNVPSDSSAERWVSDALFLYSSAPVPTIIPPRGAPTPVPEARPSP